MNVPSPTDSAFADENAIPNRTLALKLWALARKLGRALEQVSRAEERLGELECELRDILEHLDPTTSIKGSPPKPGRLPPKTVYGVASALLISRTDGSGILHINARADGIRLPSSLATLMDILKTTGGDSDDGWVGWKSIASVQSALNERTGQKHTRASVKQLIYRLRRMLRDYGENPLLVQGDRRRGYRFVVRPENKLPPKPESQ